MKFYFRLQYQRTIRYLEELGIHPMVVLVLTAIIFSALSFYLFYKTEMAHWIYSLLGVSFLLNSGKQERNDLLKSIFRKSDYLRIRMIENILVIFPFCLLLCYQNFFLLALALLPVSLGLVVFNNLPKIQTTIPTPFKRIPFEFIIGFRRSFGFIILAYLLAGKAVQVGNYNLGIFSLMVLFFISMGFYSRPEKEFYCWIFAMGPAAFLRKKIKDGLIAISMLTLPVLITFMLCFPDKYWITIAVYTLGYVYLVSMILAKYSAFPGELTIIHGILYALSILFPPMLMIIIPIFYVQAKRRLTTILGW